VLTCDTSGLIAYFDASDAHHTAVSEVVDADPGPFIVSPYVVAELDYLLMTRRGVDAELAVLAELSGDAFVLPSIEAADLRQIRDLVSRYRDQRIGVTDASLVVLAGRYRTDRVLTLDRRHFQVLQTPKGEHVSLLPS
jgi:uncharacterized protein